MSVSTPHFQPFYDPYEGDRRLTYPIKAVISIAVGCGFIFPAYWVLPDKLPFFEQSTWILGVIMAASIFSLYVATDVFRSNLATIARIEEKQPVSQKVIDVWLSNRSYLIAGLVWGCINTGISYGLGIPEALVPTRAAATVLTLGYFAAGFCAGMGGLAIAAVIVLYLKFAPLLQSSLDVDDPDGSGGIRRLGDSLWFFCLLTANVGVLVAIYMFGVSWENLHTSLARGLFTTWVAFPFLFAVSIVLIPGLAVRRQVGEFKHYRAAQLKRERSQLYHSFKEFEPSEDDAIVETKREISQKLDRINDQMEKLRKLRKSHLDS